MAFVSDTRTSDLRTVPHSPVTLQLASFIQHGTRIKLFITPRRLDIVRRVQYFKFERRIIPCTRTYSRNIIKTKTKNERRSSEKTVTNKLRISPVVLHFK